MTAELHHFVPHVATAATAATGGGESGGLVKGMGVVTYTVTDDLTVTPMLTSSCMAQMNKLCVKEVGSLEECTLTLGMNEVSKVKQIVY